MTFSVCSHPEIWLPWQRDLTSSPFYDIIILQTGHVSWLELEKGRKYKLITRAMRPLLFGKLLSSHCHLIETEAGERYIYEF